MSGKKLTIGVACSGSRATGGTIIEAVRDLGHYAKHIDVREEGIYYHDGELRSTTDFDVLLNWVSISRSIWSWDDVGVLRGLEKVADAVVNPVDGLLTSNNKFDTVIALSDDDVPCPDTEYAGSFGTLYDILARSESVQKPLFGGGGNDVRKVGYEELRPLPGRQTGLVQECIETAGESHTDYRVFVVGDSVVGSMERDSGEDSWLTNISAGGNGSESTLPDVAEQIAIRAAEAVGVDICGVDLIQSRDGDWYVLEANTPAGFAKLTDTVRNPAYHIAAHAIEKGGGSVCYETVEDRANAKAMSDSVNSDSLCGNIYAIQEDAKVELCGKSDSTEVSYRLNEDLERSVLDPSIASEIGAGPVTDCCEDPREGSDRTSPRAAVGVKCGKDAFTISPCLSEVEGDDIILSTGVFVTNFNESNLPTESDG